MIIPILFLISMSSYLGVKGTHLFSIGLRSSSLRTPNGQSKTRNGMGRLILRILFLFISILSTLHSARANQPPPGIAGFGKSCVAVAPSGDPKFLTNQSAYGYLQSFIDLTQNVVNGSCTDNIQRLDLCLYNDAKNPPCDFVTFNVNDIKTVGSISLNPTLNQDISLTNISLQAVMSDPNTLCLNMSTPYGSQPLVCKHLTNPSVDQAQNQQQAQCTPASDACFGINSSQSIFNFSGSAIECVTDVMNNIFFNTTRCPQNEESYLSSLKAFATFQQTLQNSITALLILYVMFYGFKIITNPEKFGLESVVSHVMKFMLVTYFSIGLGPLYFQDGVKTIHNGMIDWGLPILRGVTNDFAQMVFSAADDTNLCKFDPDTYPPGKSGYAIWDTIDCKLGAYIGVKSVYHLGDVVSNPRYTEVNTIGANNTDPLSSVLNPDNDATAGEAALFSVILLLMLGGNVLIVIMLICFLVVFVSIVLGFISAYIICVLTLHVMVYISPIFIPLALFERTSQYFESWLKVVIGCTLQPMVIGGFVALMMNLYDGTLYGSDPGCQFKIHELQYTFSNVSGNATQTYNTYEMRLPQNDYASCTGTLGYKLIAYILGEGLTSNNLILFSIPFIKDTLNAVGDATLLMVFSIIFYYFSFSLYTFASDLTGGVNIESVAFNMGKAVDAAMQAVKKAGSAVASAATKGKGGGGGGGGDKGGGKSGGGDAAPKGAREAISAAAPKGK